MASPAVNKPTDTKQKEADINRKLQLYGIFYAFKTGKAPSNEQIDVALNSFLASRALSRPSDKLSAEGKGLVDDTKEVVKLAKQLLLSKNDGNLIQDFIYQTTQFDPNSHNTPGAPISKDSAKRDGDDALQGLRTLGTLLITNGQFRKLLKDATVLLRDMIGDGATNAANLVRPADEHLQQLDEPAPDNTWHEKPDLSKDSLKNQARGIYGGDAKKDAKDVANAATNAAVPRGSNAPATQQLDQGAGFDAARATANQKLDQNTDQETQDKVKQRNEEYRRKAREYLKKKMPQERRDQVIFRLKKMVLECQQHPEYSQAIQTLLRLAEEYGGHGRNYGKGSADSAKGIRTGLAAAEDDLRTLIERFANGTSTEDLWQSIGQIYKDADKDDELRGWFKQTDSYIRRCLLEQGYILEDASTEEWNRLYDHGRYLLRDKYRGHTDRVIDEAKFIVDQFDQDPLNKAFGQACQKLFNDLGNDENGKPAFKPHLIKDLTEVIIPAIMENVAYIPIPRIEYSDPQFDAIIENLVLESDNFMPNILEVSSDNYWRWGRKKIANKNKNTIDVKVTGIQMDLRDVSYHIKRKSGFPSLTDTGVLDILLPGDGFSFRMKVSTADKHDNQNVFKVEKVDVSMKGLKINFKKSNHKFLFSLFKPLALRAVRPALQKAVEKAIKDQCNKLDHFLYEVKQEAARVAETAKEDPEQVVNIYQRYYNAAQKNMLKGKKKAEEVAQDKKVNVAMTKQDSIFPNINLPGGISTKATEYRELAGKGEKWESPVFSIGSANKSTDIPAVPRIERKPHPVADVTHTDNLAGNLTDNANGNANGALRGEPLLAANGANGHNMATNGKYANGRGLTAY
ncbi:putative C32A11.02c-like protein [Cladobotryum mycophilum]|uniref:C32A11.02c-like protein n=1 Tax=Cladobotryum mycophilum TaxID=491253 RepID=A0ABR0SZG6_9HYPO